MSYSSKRLEFVTLSNLGCTTLTFSQKKPQRASFLGLYNFFITFDEEMRQKFSEPLKEVIDVLIERLVSSVEPSPKF